MKIVHIGICLSAVEDQMDKNLEHEMEAGLIHVCVYLYIYIYRYVYRFIRDRFECSFSNHSSCSCDPFDAIEILIRPPTYPRQA